MDTNKTFTPFNISQNDLISITGSGGKTHLLFQLAHEINKSGGNVITSISTKMQHEISRFCNNIVFAGIDKSHIREIKTLEKSLTSFPFIAGGVENGKFLAPPVDMIKKKFAGQFNTNAALIFEADGSKRMPLKLYADHEPVLTGEETKKIIVISLKALGEKFTQSNTHRILEPDGCEYINKTIDELQISKLILKKHGYLEKTNAYSGESYLVFSNISREEQVIAAKKIASIVAEKYPHIAFFVKGCLFGYDKGIYHRIEKLR